MSESGEINLENMGELCLWEYANAQRFSDSDEYYDDERETVTNCARELGELAIAMRVERRTFQSLNISQAYDQLLKLTRAVDKRLPPVCWPLGSLVQVRVRENTNYQESHYKKFNADGVIYKEYDEAGNQKYWRNQNPFESRWAIYAEDADWDDDEGPKPIKSGPMPIYREAVGVARGILTQAGGLAVLQYADGRMVCRSTGDNPQLMRIGEDPSSGRSNSYIIPSILKDNGTRRRDDYRYDATITMEVLDYKPNLEGYPSYFPPAPEIHTADPVASENED